MPTTQISKADRVAVIEAAHRCFAASHGAEFRSYLHGPLLDYLELYTRLPGFLTPLLWGSKVRSLRVGSIEGDAAFCDCDVVTVGSYATPAGWRGRSVGHITGPLVLERTGDGWKVVDYALNGRRLLRTIRSYDSSFAVHVLPLVVQPRAIELATGGTIVIVDVVNESTVEFAIDQAMLRGKGRVGPWLRSREFASFAGETRIPAGRTRRLVLLWNMAQVLLKPTVKVALRFAGASGELVRVEVELPFRRLPEPTVAAYESR